MPLASLNGAMFLAGWFISRLNVDLWYCNSRMYSDYLLLLTEHCFVLMLQNWPSSRRSTQCCCRAMCRSGGRVELRPQGRVLPPRRQRRRQPRRAPRRARLSAPVWGEGPPAPARTSVCINLQCRHRTKQKEKKTLARKNEIIEKKEVVD